MIGILVTMALASAGPVPSTPTVGQWAGQDVDARRIALVGAIEGVLLATSAVDGASLPVRTSCFNGQTTQYIENELVAKARTAPDTPLVTALVGIEGCSTGKAAR